MWILESEGDFLKGKRVWLRPGKKYLFGRVKNAGVRHAIDDSTISRKHLVIEVAPVNPGDGSHIHTRSKVTVTDQSSKCGTTVDGERIKRPKELGGQEHTIKLGRYQHVLRVKWEPIVLTFSLSSKELKLKDPLAHVRSRLEDLDIKMVVPYLVGTTTHVVQSKRNTAKGLQALINGKPIVMDSYIDALVYAATPEDLNNLESLSPLEEDFDSTLPGPTSYLPPPGKEPVPRPADAFAPNLDRISVFEGYTFVFCDNSQFENLQAPITNGHGKALLYQLENGKTTADELVQYMRNAAGQKGFGGSDEIGGVVLVRFRSKGEYADWSINLGNQVALALDQRVIEQGEFLDAILNNDATPLRRALPREEQPAQTQQAIPSQPNVSERPEATDPVEATTSGHDTRSGKTAERPATGRAAAERRADEQKATEQEVTQQTTEQAAPERPPAGRRAKRSRALPNYVSKIKSFDDGFDIKSIPVHNLEKDDEPEISQPVESNDASPAHESPPSHAHESPQAVSKQEEDDVVTDLLPGAAAMKRLHPEGRAATKRPESNPPRDNPKPKRQKLNVLEAARQRREAQEEAARERIKEEEDTIQTTLSSMDVERMKSLAVVEEMEIPVRRRNTPARNGDGSGGGSGSDGEGDTRSRRWDERWNGRKNFKNFRRAGEGGGRAGGLRRRVQAVIVPLEEASKKGFGIGDEYWAGGGRGDGTSGGGRSGRSGRSGSGGGRATSTTTTAKNNNRETAINQEDDHSMDMDTSQPASVDTGGVSASAGSTGRGRKRPRQEEIIEDSDSEDELRFRFRRRKRR